MNLNRRLPGGRSLRTGASTAVATAALLALSACGGSDGDSGSDSGSDGPDARKSASASASAHHNQADVDFATQMIPHHRQAVQMADLAPTRASSGQVKELSKKIKKAQDPEIRTMTGWLKQWDEKVPAEDDAMSGMDHGGGHADHGGGARMPGMMSGKQLDGLKKSKGRDFDTAFLKLMIEHHKGAVTMAETEQRDGTYGPAKRLADAVITAQTKEITEMNGLLGKG
ncbi:DUF305 domain-containing protein [Streptomyces armeniacus]|uniref:DUF305 domain-containing protein n=1 Tax=Streptomyces armeniacus TaxID=83291 RepID=A0A345XTW1_9ACTN|nr:DUF305 domain-containing protein [Streptomyces armeniacus]AXK35077.1 DUF305 domain-containing protein [Streptomyces armeniacus]